VGRIAALVLAAVVATACSAGQTAADTSARPTPTIHYTPEPTATPSPVAAISAAPSPTATAAPDYNALPVAASDPAALAAQIKSVEDALRDPKVQGAQLAYMGHLQQLAYSRLADYPEWQPAVLAALPQKYAHAVSDALDAGKNLRSMNGAVPTRLPDWKIVAPKPIDDLMAFYKEAEATYGIEWQYLAAINLVETRMGRIRGLSEAGAQGPMQFMPATWGQYGRGDVNDDHDAILGAARYLKAAGAPANMAKALFAYNHAQAYVNALIDYADAMKSDPSEFRGYWGWQVYYPTKDGPILLPTGWTNE
jgi:membrane-bound lytic murein transglycosylase B